MGFTVKHNFFDRVEDYFKVMKTKRRSEYCFEDVAYILQLLASYTLDDVGFCRLMQLSDMFDNVLIDDPGYVEKEEK